jgi:hypothetical protein
MLEAGEALAASPEPYVAQWGTAIERWCSLFDLSADEPAELRLART